MYSTRCVGSVAADVRSFGHSDDRAEFVAGELPNAGYAQSLLSAKVLRLPSSVFGVTVLRGYDKHRTPGGGVGIGGCDLVGGRVKSADRAGGACLVGWGGMGLGWDGDVGGCAAGGTGWVGFRV